MDFIPTPDINITKCIYCTQRTICIVILSTPIYLDGTLKEGINNKKKKSSYHKGSFSHLNIPEQVTSENSIIKHNK